MIERRLWRHSVVVEVAVFASHAEIAVTSLSISPILVHVVCVVGAAVVRVVVWVAAGMARLGVWLVHVLALRGGSGRLLATQRGVGSVVAAVLCLVVPGVRLLLLVRGCSCGLTVLFRVDRLPNVRA